MSILNKRFDEEDPPTDSDSDQEINDFQSYLLQSDSDEESFVDISEFFNENDEYNEKSLEVNSRDESPTRGRFRNTDLDEENSFSGWNFDRSESPKIQSQWDKLCYKLDIDQRLFKLKITQSNGNCLFHSLAIAFKELEDVTDDKIKYLRKMVADTILDQDNEEAKCVLLTWNMLYTMSKIENDYELVRHYEHMKCLEGVSEDDLLSDENRQKVHDEMMKPVFWGEEYCLKVFEKELKLKFVIINSDKQKIETTNNKFNAHEIVLLYYSSNHYQIISYKNEYVFDIMGDLGDIEEMMKENDINIYNSNSFLFQL